MGQTDSGGLIMEQALGVVILIYFVATGFLVFNVSSLARKNKEILERLKSLEHGCMRDKSAFHSAVRLFEEHKAMVKSILNPKGDGFFIREHGIERFGTTYTSKLDNISETVQIIEHLINYKHHPGKEIKHTSDIDVLHKKIEELAKKVGYEYKKEETKKIDAGFIKTK